MLPNGIRNPAHKQHNSVRTDSSPLRREIPEVQRYFRARVHKLWISPSPPSPVPSKNILPVRCTAVINIAIAQVQFSGSSALTWYQTLVLNKALALSLRGALYLRYYTCFLS